jgi:hypothetical protein
MVVFEGTWAKVAVAGAGTMKQTPGTAECGRWAIAAVRLACFLIMLALESAALANSTLSARKFPF